MRGFGKGIQPGRARSILEKTNDHRRFIRGCKRRAEEAHVKNSRPVPDRREARLLRFFRQADTREATSGGRGERIRTSGLYVPNVALYQAKLHPDGTAAGPRRSTPLRSTKARHDERSTDRIDKSSRAARWIVGGNSSSVLHALSASARAASRVAARAPVSRTI